MHSTRKASLIKEISEYIQKSETPGYERTYSVGEYELYNWRSGIFIIKAECDGPASEYSEEELSEILGKLKSGDYEETRWDLTTLKWIKIDHKKHEKDDGKDESSSR